MCVMGFFQVCVFGLNYTGNYYFFLIDNFCVGIYIYVSMYDWFHLYVCMINILFNFGLNSSIIFFSFI